MYEQDRQRILDALANVASTLAIRVWSVANSETLGIEAIALMEAAGVPLPPGNLESLVSLRTPRGQVAGVVTEFHAWNNQELATRTALGGTPNLGEIRLGDSVYASEIERLFPGLTDQQVRRFQLRAMIHELFHVLDFRDVAQLVPTDRDAALTLQASWIGFGSNLAGYARNEIHTDGRAELILGQAGLLFPELRRSFDDYKRSWEGVGAMPEPD